MAEWLRITGPIVAAVVADQKQEHRSSNECLLLPMAFPCSHACLQHLYVRLLSGAVRSAHVRPVVPGLGPDLLLRAHRVRHVDSGHSSVPLLGEGQTTMKGIARLVCTTHAIGCVFCAIV